MIIGGRTRITTAGDVVTKDRAITFLFSKYSAGNTSDGRINMHAKQAVKKCEAAKWRRIKSYLNHAITCLVTL